MTERGLSRRALLAGLGGATAAALAGCSAPSRQHRTTKTPSEGSDGPKISLSADDEWTTFGYDSGHSGHNPSATGVGDEAEQVWGSAVEGIYTLREPAVADGRVYVGSDTTMWAFDAVSGERAWDVDLDSMAHQFAPTFCDDTLYAVSKEAGGVNNEAAGYVWALDPESGGTQWKQSLPVTSTVAHDGERLYVAAKVDEQGYVQAFDPATGDRSWRFDVPDAPRSYVTGTPASADGTLFVPATHLADDGTKTGALYALDPETGDVDWTFETASGLPTAPVVVEGRIHLATRGGTVHALTTAGDTEWSMDTGSGILTRPTYADGRLFALTVNDIVALDDAGDEQWRSASDRTQMTGMAVAGDTLYVGGEPLFALDVATGDEIFDIPVGEWHGSYGAPVVVDDVLYAGICIKQTAGAQYDNYVRAYV
jgi:outer membrane protein assembly factor BamB